MTETKIAVKTPSAVLRALILTGRRRSPGTFRSNSVSLKDIPYTQVVFVHEYNDEASSRPQNTPAEIICQLELQRTNPAEARRVLTGWWLQDQPLALAQVKRGLFAGRVQSLPYRIMCRIA